MTLVLLLTAVTGAWAEDTYTVTFKANGNTKTVENVTLPHTFELDPIITELYPSLSGGHGSPAGTSASGNTNVTAYNNNSKHYATISASFEGAVTVTGQFFKDFTNHQYTLEINCMEKLVAISDDKTEATIKMPQYDVTASYTIKRDISVDVTATMGDGTDGVRYRVKKAQQGEGYEPAEMDMMQVLALVAVNDGIEQKALTLNQDFFCRIYKLDEQTLQPVGDGMLLSEFNFAPGLYALKAFAQDGSDYDGETALSNTFKLFQGYDLTLTSAQASSVAVTIGDAAVTPQEGGRIQGVEIGKSVKLSVSEGYMFSDMFTGYKVSFTPVEGFAWSKVGCYYWGNYGNNNIFNPVQWPGVEMTKNGNNWETTINVNGLTNIIFNDFQTNNQQTSDLPFASGAADNLGSYTIADAVEMTYNNAKTEATFSMPASDVGMSFNVKRNLGVKTAAEMAERIRINKTGDTYSPIQMTDVQPTVTNNLDAQNPVVLEFGKDYSTTLQKKGEGQDEWIDTQDYGVGTYRLMVTGAGEYGGTCYTNEFELYAGYEVTVAAGEYATFYGKEAVVVEGEDAELYTISSVSDTEAVLSDKIETAPKETPLLVYNKSTEDKTFLLIPTTTEAADVTVAKEFRGTAEAMEMPGSSATRDFYVCTGKAFEWVRDAGVIAANKCWLQIGEQVAAARAMTRSIVGGGNTTNIDDVRWQMEDGNYYDLQGRKVEKPNRKGIYIHNGKKVIVR